MKLLTICIPTFNRSSHVISQLKFLQNELQDYFEFIDVKVADNFSDGRHKSEIKKFHKSNHFFDLILNDSNLGLIRNIYNLLNLVNTKYVWFLGDDDILKKGIIKNLFNIISDTSNTYYIFHNHSVFTDNPEVFESSIDLLGYSRLVDNGKKCLIDLLNKNGTINMFMSSCVYPTDVIKEVSMLNRKKLIVDPLFFSFYSAVKYNVYIVEEIFILDRMTDTSWSRESGKVFSILVPEVLIDLNNHGYNESEIVSLLNKYYINNKGNYLRMLIQSNRAQRKKILSFLGISQVFLFLPSVRYNLLRLSDNFFNFIK